MRERKRAERERSRVSQNGESIQGQRKGRIAPIAVHGPLRKLFQVEGLVSNQRQERQGRERAVGHMRAVTPNKNV